ncbi:MAG TPA: GNAT family N-acetyltransferase [Sandaracinaceae bacterium LLY-WYZ-13_1]|nr:GNAT family N-acetyltransferase [Sandaracinaceae bacterium LLY-WYZ-13_1]
MNLTTERTILRAGVEDDAPAIADFFERNRAHFERWDPKRPPAFFEPPFWRARIAEDARRAEADRGYRLWIADRHDGGAGARVIGFVHFSNVVRGAFQACHLGFGIDRAREGTGRMREALEAALGWAFEELNLHRVEANHRPENVRSAALLERLGFVPQGYARHYLHIHGAWRDHVLTALSNPDWRPPGARS